MAEAEAIVIDQRLSRADYFRVLMLMTLRKWYVIGLILAGALILVIGLATDVYPLLCIFIFLFIIGYAPVGGLLQVFDRQNRSLFLPVRLTFTDTEIAVDSGESAGTVSWDIYHDWKKLGGFYILTLSGQMSHFIPAAGLSAQETERFEALLRANIKDRR